MPSRSFPAYAPSVPDVRRYVTEALGDLPADMREIAGLLVSELATNAVRHAGGQFGVQVQYTPESGLVWIGVTDTGPGDPVLQTPPVTAERGRGLGPQPAGAAPVRRRTPAAGPAPGGRRPGGRRRRPGTGGAEGD